MWLIFAPDYGETQGLGLGRRCHKHGEFLVHCTVSFKQRLSVTGGEKRFLFPLMQNLLYFHFPVCISGCECIFQYSWKVLRSIGDHPRQRYWTDRRDNEVFQGVMIFSRICRVEYFCV